LSSAYRTPTLVHFAELQRAMPTYSTFQSGPLVKTTTQEKLSPYTCEFVGTFVLVFVVVCCKAGAHASAFMTPVAVAFTLIALIYATAHVSGGHLNPAVTLTIWLTRKISFLTAVLYIVLQVLAGVLAGLLGALTFNASPTVAPIAPFDVFEACMAEGIYTMMLCFVVVNVAVSRRKNPQDDPNQFFALAIGLVIIAGGYSVGHISGAYFNPALAIGLDLASFIDSLTLGSSLLYLVAQVIGAFGAAFLFHVFRHYEISGDFQELMDYRTTLVVRLGAEFIGTFILVLTFGLSTVLGTALLGPWATAAAYVCMMYAIGDISGGHYNPAITLAVTLSGRGKLPKEDCIFYILAQCFAGLMCSLAIDHFHALGPKSHTAFGLRPKEGFDWLQVGVSEFVFTTLLCFVFISIATAKLPMSYSTNQNFYYALAIGMCLAVGGFACGTISGGVLNPAVALGLCLEESNGGADARKTLYNAYVHIREKMGYTYSHSSSTTPVPDHDKGTLIDFLLYGLFELLGALLATLLFHVTHASEFIAHASGKAPFARDSSHYA